MPALEPSLDGQGLRVAVIASRFNHLLSLRLVEACETRLLELGCAAPDLYWVPGAFELPLAARALADTARYHALVALGAIVRGTTPHFDYVCRGVTDGLAALARERRLPVAFGVLTVNDVTQALERAACPGEPGTNKGRDAAEVAVEMAGLLRGLKLDPGGGVASGCPAA
jgi:6,7-dimethyl-8-ribityllumazine synthase